MATNPKTRPPKAPTIDLHIDGLERHADLWTVTVTAIVTRGTDFVVGREIEFSIGGGHKTNVPTDTVGQARAIINNVHWADMATVRAELTNTAIYARREINFPPKKEPVDPNKPTHLMVQAKRFGNKVNIDFWPVNGDNGVIPDKAQVIIIDQGERKTPDAPYLLDLKPGEERELSVRSAKRGTKVVSYTFRGRTDATPNKILTVVHRWASRSLLAACVILFFVAMYKGGGEPVGLQALKKVASEAPAPSPIRNYYYSSAKDLIGEAPQPAAPVEKQPTWWYWKIWGAMLVGTVIYFLSRLVWDWHLVAEWWMQRARKIDLRPPEEIAATEKSPTKKEGTEEPTPKGSEGLWGKVKEGLLSKLTAALSGAAIYELLEGLGQLVKRRT